MCNFSTLKRVLFLLSVILVFVGKSQACPDLPQITPLLFSAEHSIASLNGAWELRQKVRSEMKELASRGLYDQKCALKFAQFFSDLRIHEDYLSFASFYKGMLSTNSAFIDGNEQVITSFSELKDLKKNLRSGDIILSRGNAYTSAAIAHLGRETQQFSHLSLVYKNPKNNKLYTIEAHIEIGVVAKPLKAHIKEDNMRTSVFRFHDEELAHKAAEYIYKRARRRSMTGFNIYYDFSMDMDEGKRLFCSEVLSHALEFVSGGKVQIPLFKSNLSEEKPEFIKTLGIFEEEAFLPGDLEIDPRFDLVAEWKDWARVRDSLEKDAVLMAIYKWMDQYNYEFTQKNNPKAWIAKNVGYVMRRIPVVHFLVRKMMPLNMSKDLAGLFVVVDQVGKILQSHLHEKVEVYVQKKGEIPTLEWMVQELDRFRLEDNHQEEPIFHKMLGPRL